MSRPPGSPHTRDELLRCADVLGTFGVTAAELRRGPDDELEDALAAVLADGQDPTAVLRRTVAGSDRGLHCSARYARRDLEAELQSIFEAIDWTCSVDPESPFGGPTDRLTVRVTDPHGRERETTITYPETPLGTDNLPAVLAELNDTVLEGTDGCFVCLSAGVDRWQAALVDARELEELRERYGRRLSVLDRPLLPTHDLQAYVPDGSTERSSVGSNDDDPPWPVWARRRERSTARAEMPRSPSPTVDDIIEEAEPSSGDSDTQPGDTSSGNDGAGVASTGASTAGFELHGSPSVSRVADDGTSSEPASAGSPTEPDRPRGWDDPRNDDGREADDDSSGFGSLSGSVTTTRVSNDSFGSDVEWEHEDDRYQALGAALGAGGAVTVRGLLDDESFLPELPAAEPEKTRISYDEPFDPGALSEAKAAAEESGFIWVDSGSLETTRVSNG